MGVTGSQLSQSFDNRPFNVLLLGNPGVGKSTLLNCLSDGITNFESGLSYGGGLTKDLHTQEVPISGRNVKFMDVPGLADPELRGLACKAIHQALNRPGEEFKVMFVVCIQCGRVVESDLYTINCVLESCPDLNQKFGIIINQVDEMEWEDLQESENLTNLMTPFCRDFSYNKVRDMPPSYLIPKVRALRGKNKVMHLDCHDDLVQWAMKLPPATVRRADLIPVDRYMKMQTEFQGEIHRLEKDKEATKALHKQALAQAAEAHAANEKVQMQRDGGKIPLTRVIEAGGSRLYECAVGGGSPKIYNDIPMDGINLGGLWWTCRSMSNDRFLCYYSTEKIKHASRFMGVMNFISWSPARSMEFRDSCVRDAGSVVFRYAGEDISVPVKEEK